MNIFDSIVVTDIDSAYNVSSDQGRSELISRRKYYGLSFCVEGQISYFHNGKTYVSHKGNAIILPKGETYRLHGDKKGSFPLVNFDTLEQLCDAHVVIPIDDVNAFIDDFTKLRSCLGDKKNRSKAMSLFYNIIHKLEKTERDTSILAPALDYIERNYSSPELNNTLLSKQCNISEVYFRRLFSKKFGMTPRQYVIEFRISKAKEFLPDGGVRVNDVAEKCGFTNPYHFGRKFKELVGMTPGEYARKNRIYKI